MRSSKEWIEAETEKCSAQLRSSTSNHSKIEKRRRDRLNELINELSALVPAACNKKLDKLSVLRLALRHIMSLTSINDRNLDHIGDGVHIPVTELITLLENSVDAFYVITDVNTGNIIHASESAVKCVSCTAEELIDRNWFDILHPNDVQVFKNEVMMSHFDCKPLAKTSCDYVNDIVSSSTSYYSQQNDLDIGSKRMFLCRINVNLQNKQGSEPKYQRFKCSGILREGDPPTATLVIVRWADRIGADQSFQMKLSPSGRIFACDDEVSSALGYLPHKLLANSYYDLINEGDLIDVSYHHKQVLKTLESRQASYRLRAITQESVMCNCTWQPFINPWSDQLQFIVLLHHTGVTRNDKELSPEQSTLKQLLSNKKAPTVVLGAARFGDSMKE